MPSQAMRPFCRCWRYGARASPTRNQPYLIGNRGTPDDDGGLPCASIQGIRHCWTCPVCASHGASAAAASRLAVSEGTQAQPDQIAQACGVQQRRNLHGSTASAPVAAVLPLRGRPYATRSGGLVSLSRRRTPGSSGLKQRQGPGRRRLGLPMASCPFGVPVAEGIT